MSPCLEHANFWDCPLGSVEAFTYLTLNKDSMVNECKSDGESGQPVLILGLSLTYCQKVWSFLFCSWGGAGKAIGRY